MKISPIFYSFCLSLFFFVHTTYSQTNNPVVTNHAFLLTPPDARTAGMGNAGGAINPDANAIFWNPGKIVFNKKKSGVSVSYVPWSNEYGDNQYQGSLAGYYKLSDKRAISISSRYFHQGNIVVNTPDGLWADLGGKSMAFSLAYSYKLNKNLGLGVTGRLIHFDHDNYYKRPTLHDDKSGNTMAMDVGLFYKKQVKLLGRTMQWNTGAVISNFGPKSYYINNFNYFSPAKLQLSKPTKIT